MVKVFRRKVEGKKTVEMHWQECGEIRGGNSRSTIYEKEVEARRRKLERFVV